MGQKNTANFAFDLQHTQNNNTSWRPQGAGASFFKWATEQAARHQHIALSSEELDRPSVDMGRLVEALRGFRTTVIVSYRPFYEFVSSIHNEVTKKLVNPTPISEYLTFEKIGVMDLMFTAKLVARYERHFHDVRVLPLGPRFLDEYFCTILNATSTCADVLRAPHEVKNARAKPPCKATPDCPDKVTQAVVLAMSLEYAKQTRLHERTLYPLEDSDQTRAKVASGALCTQCKS